VEDGHQLLDDLEHDSVPSAYQQTKNEIAVKIVIPEIEEVGVEEVLEKVGEIMSIVDTVVIVRGMTSEKCRALDSDTLLVFEDRKVLGYVSCLPFRSHRTSDLLARSLKHLAQPANLSIK
jgi:hypothetical protein